MVSTPILSPSNKKRRLSRNQRREDDDPISHPNIQSVIRKRTPNAFFLYRKSFATLYPEIDRLEPRQGPKSQLVGALWREEDEATQESFFDMQRVNEEAVRRAYGIYEPLKRDAGLLARRRNRVRAKRAEKMEALSERSQLIVELWRQGLRGDALTSRVLEYEGQDGQVVRFYHRYGFCNKAVDAFIVAVFTFGTSNTNVRLSCNRRPASTISL
jgi:hypothetical protein